MRLNDRDHGARVLQVLLVTAVMVAGTVAFASTSRADSNQIDTTPSWNGSRALSPFGYPNTTTYGQTVTAPAEPMALSSFTFYMSLPSSLLFRGEVYAWDDTNDVATGSALYESPPMHTDASHVMQAVTFDTGGVQLIPGAKYILFATVSKDAAADAQAGSGSWAFVGSDVYPGGGFFFDNDGGNPSEWTAGSWLGGPSDFVFKASFAPPDGDLAISGTPNNMTVDATGPSGAAVSYAMPSVADEDTSGAGTVSCSPASGSMFAIGTTTVSCSVSDPDDSNSPVSSSFTVTVEGAPQQLADVDSTVIGAGPGSSLAAKVVTAQSYLAQGNVAGTCSVLRALVNELRALSGKSVAAATAGSLIADTQRIEAVLSC